MRWVALVCLLTTGCDVVLGLESRPKRDASPVDVPLNCPAAFGTGRYLHVPTPTFWPDAETACVLLDTEVGDGTYTHLAVLTDGVECGLAARGLPDLDVWVGLSDRATDDTFLWVTDELLATQPIPWGIGQPNSTSSRMQCATLDPGAAILDDSGCDTTPHPYLCECDVYAEQPDHIF